MAKALLGHVGGPDPRLISEVQRLRQRVDDLESEVRRLQRANDSLTAAVLDEPLVVDVRQPEPVLV